MIQVFLNLVIIAVFFLACQLDESVDTLQVE